MRVNLFLNFFFRLQFEEINLVMIGSDPNYLLLCDLIYFRSIEHIRYERNCSHMKSLGCLGSQSPGPIHMRRTYILLPLHDRN